MQPTKEFSSKTDTPQNQLKFIIYTIQYCI